MKKQERKWTLVILRNGRPGEGIPLPSGPSTLGRDPTCDIPLADPSVSRRHAVITVEAAGVRIRDLESHNGIKVNGVPRREAILQTGDRIDVGDFQFRLEPSTSGSVTFRALQETLESARHAGTVDNAARLPESLIERHLATLYHACFWVTEGVEENAFVPRCLRLLRESLNSLEIHLYGADRRLEAWAGEDAGPRAKPSLKLAGFLIERFQELSDASTISGRELFQHQVKAGQYHFLVGPLRIGGASPGPSPFLVLVRPTEWNEFTSEDRVLVQAVCLLWARGLVRAHQFRELRNENSALRRRAGTPQLVGSSKPIEVLRQRAEKVARHRVSVLIRGETGSGKEVVASFIHENSPWRHGPFVMVNCAAIPDGMIESELFGHIRGAYTGAVTPRAGRFVQADGGTLFLDEIGDMPLATQAKLLRVLETGLVEPLGSDESKPVQVRLVAATNQDLEGMVQAKTFRSDLLFRLDVETLPIPPLRERIEDLPDLANFFFRQLSEETGAALLEFSPEALTILGSHPWPGNVRELKHLVQRCAIDPSGPTISVGEVKRHLRPSGSSRT